MKLEFKEITLTNFLSFVDGKFDFSSHHGRILITGRNKDIVGDGSRNGAGKTNLFQGLSYALFGDLIHPVGNQFIRSRTQPIDAKTEVSLDFSVDGTSYRIVRSLTGKKSRASKLQLLKENKDGGEPVDITKSSISETQEYIEKKLICCSRDTFFRVVLLSSDQSYNFFNLNKSEKEKFLESLFDMRVFSKMKEIVHKELLQTRGELSTQSRLLDSERSGISSLEASISEFGCAAKRKLESAGNALNRAMAERQKFMSDNKVVEPGNPPVPEDTSKFSDEISALSVRIEKGRRLVEELDRSKLESEAQIRSLNRTISAQQALLEKHGRITGLLCEKCLPKYESNFKLSDIRSAIESDKNEILSKQKIIDDSERKIVSYRKGIDELVEKSGTISDKRSAIDSANRSKQVEYGRLLSLFNGYSSELKRLDNAVRDAENRHHEALEESKNASTENPYVKLLSEAKEKLENTTKKISDTEKIEVNLLALESIVAPDNIRRSIVKDFIGSLNSRIQFYLTRMGARFACVFDEDFDYRFLTESGEAEYNNFSAGEKMRLSIAISLAFRDFMEIRFGLQPNILVMDEYFDSNLDTLAIDGLLDIISKFADGSGGIRKNVYVISHRSEVYTDMFDEFITIEKNNGVSSIVYGA
jgi:DNA repair exonuclease SbcCD ATPase subunit